MLELVLVLKGNRNRLWTRLEAFVTYLGVVLVSCLCPLWHHKGLASRLLGFRIKNMDFSNFFWVNWKWSTSNLTFTWWRGCRGLWAIETFFYCISSTSDQASSDSKHCSYGLKVCVLKLTAGSDLISYLCFSSHDPVESLSWISSQNSLKVWFFLFVFCRLSCLFTASHWNPPQL